MSFWRVQPVEEFASGSKRALGHQCGAAGLALPPGLVGVLLPGAFPGIVTVPFPLRHLSSHHLDEFLLSSSLMANPACQLSAGVVPHSRSGGSARRITSLTWRGPWRAARSPG